MKLDYRRVAPTLAAALLAAAYVIIAPPSSDLPAHLFRAQLFRAEGFTIWNNFWYAGHHTPGYSVLFPPVSGTLTPQLAAAIAAVGTAALFEPLARRHFGPEAWLGSLVFGVATATDLYTGRLAFAFGVLPAIGAALALDRRRTTLAATLAVLAALSSPVAALFLTVFATGAAIGALHSARRLRPAIPGALVTLAALVPVGLLAMAFPEGGREPFAFSALWPIPVLGIGALVALPRDAMKLRAGVALYTLGTIAAYLVPSAVGSNAARLGTLIAAPLAALLWWRTRVALLALVAVPLLYLEWQAPVHDISAASGEPSTKAAFYQPLLGFLARQSGPPFRIEIPFTEFHTEAYVVGRHFPLARGWERQLDIEDNPLFYSGTLTATSYRNWLRGTAVRFVAVPDAPLDYSAVSEAALVRRGLPYLRLALRTRDWRVYAVKQPTPIVSGAATLTGLHASSLALHADRTGTAIVRVRFTPYWSLAEGAGCVSPDGAYTKLTVERTGAMQLVTSFSVSRIGATSPRCS
jgi:hypothetical protein